MRLDEVSGEAGCYRRQVRGTDVEHCLANMLQKYRFTISFSLTVYTHVRSSGGVLVSRVHYLDATRTCMSL